MDLSYDDERIIFNRELSSLDKFIIKFTSILNKLRIRFVLISGYVSILFGRNRSSEDVDIFIEDAKFLYSLFNEKLDKQLLNYFIKKFNISELFNNYLL